MNLMFVSPYLASKLREQDAAKVETTMAEVGADAILPLRPIPEGEETISLAELMRRKREQEGNALAAQVLADAAAASPNRASRQREQAQAQSDHELPLCSVNGPILCEYPACACFDEKPVAAPVAAPVNRAAERDAEEAALRAYLRPLVMKACETVRDRNGYEGLADMIDEIHDAYIDDSFHDDEDRPIEAGDVVELLSGGLPMTVTSIDTFPGENDQGRVMWHDENGRITYATIETRFLRHA